MSRFDKSESGTIEEDVFSFILSDIVLDSQLLYYVGKPDEIINLQECAPSVAVCRLFYRTASLRPTPPIGIYIIPQPEQERQRGEMREDQVGGWTSG